MDLGQVLGWTTCSLSLISVWLTKNKLKWGFALGAGTQFIWIWLGYVRHIQAFLPKLLYLAQKPGGEIDEIL